MLANDIPLYEQLLKLSKLVGDAKQPIKPVVVNQPTNVRQLSLRKETVETAKVVRNITTTKKAVKRGASVANRRR